MAKKTERSARKEGGLDKYVQPIHFDDFSGTQFERLVFAYHVRTDCWKSLEWFGQQGQDRGRDILGIREVDGRADGESVCILCANWRRLTLTKIKGDIDKVVKSPSGKPDRVRIVCGCNITAGLRDQAKEYARKQDIYTCDLWSGQELEEYVRASAESHG